MTDPKIIAFFTNLTTFILERDYITISYISRSTVLENEVFSLQISTTIVHQTLGANNNNPTIVRLELNSHSSKESIWQQQIRALNNPTAPLQKPMPKKI